MNTRSSSRVTDKNQKPKHACDHLTVSQQKLVELCRSNGRQLDYRLPEESFLFSKISDQFIFWFPGGLPTGESVSVSSSRLGQKLDRQEAWFDAIRTLAVQIQDRNQFLISSHGTTTHPFLTRIATLFGIPLVEFKPFPKRIDANWFQQIAATEEKRVCSNTNDQPASRTAWFEQIEPPEHQSELPNPNPANAKLNVDELLVSIARTAVLLRVRNSGKIFGAANRRLELQQELADTPNQPLGDTTVQHPATKILTNRKLTTQKVESSLVVNGASGWWLYRPDSFGPTESPIGATHRSRGSNPRTRASYFGPGRNRF